MPGFITHLSFGEQSQSFIESPETKSIIDHHYTSYCLGLQGPDIFFYHIPAYLFYKHNIGNVMHRNSVMLFFENLFNARNTFDTPHNRRICDAYIMGFMGHYALDINCHPYIYFKSDHFNNLNRGGAYDFGKHVSLETDIDHLVLEHYKCLLPSEFDYAAAVCPSKNEQSVISLLLYIAINETFPEYKLKLKTIQGAIKSFIKLNHMMHDPKGKKKKAVRRIEQIFFKCAVISSMIPSDTIIKYQDPCNLEKKTWHNPWDESKKRNESIFELFTLAMPKYLEQIDLYMKSCADPVLADEGLSVYQQTDKCLHYRNQLLSSLSDLSYLSGLPL